MGHQAKHSLKSWRGKAALGLGAAGIAATALTMTAGSAGASSFGCNAQAGCATLNSHQTDGRAVSMDARWQQPNQIIIDYPDHTLDKATSFDKVPHTFRHGILKGDTYYTFVYAPTGDWSNMCVTAGSTGLLSLQVCTHGNSTDQQFIAGRYKNNTITAPAVVPNFSGNAEYVLENVGSLPIGNTSNPATWTVGDIHLMENTFTGDPAALPIPHGSTAPDARQMDVNGNITGAHQVVHLGAGAAFTHSTSHGRTTFEATHVTVDQNAQWYWRT